MTRPRGLSDDPSEGSEECPTGGPSYSSGQRTAVNRCTRCIMPDTVPGVTFDESGVCSLCRGYVPQQPFGEDAFRRLLADREPSASGYDCVVPLSGGRDSTYVLYLVKRVYGLNPLAVNFDNEFRNPQAIKNIERACRTLGVDLSVVQSKQNLGTKIVQSNVKTAVPLGLAYMATSFCRACAYGYHSAVWGEAQKHGIPLILWGASAAESTAQIRTRAFQGMLPSRWNKVLEPDFYKTEYYCLRQRLESPVAGNSPFSRHPPALRNPAIREIQVFDYIPWERQKIKETIMRELGWAKPAGHVTSWRTDCTLHEIVNFFFAKTVGCTVDGVGYCNMINTRQMTREEALEQEEQALQTPWEYIERLLDEQIGLSKRDLARVKAMQATLPPPRASQTATDGDGRAT